VESQTLEDTNLKLGDVVSDVMGKAARMILCAIADGETDPVRLAGFAVGRVRATQAQLVAALTGHVDDHHRFLLRDWCSSENLSADAASDRGKEQKKPKEGLDRWTPPHLSLKQRCHAVVGC